MNEADEGVGRGPGGPPYSQFRVSAGCPAPGHYLKLVGTSMDTTPVAKPINSFCQQAFLMLVFEGLLFYCWTVRTAPLGDCTPPMVASTGQSPSAIELGTWMAT
jgi:hypothetical protein